MATGDKHVPLDYEAPAEPPSISRSAALIAGLAGGALGFASIFFLGPFLCLLGAGMCGIVVSAVAAKCSRKREFLAGLLACAIAAATFVVATTIAFGAGASILYMLADLPLAWLIFALPGLFGSLFVWEGRRNRPRELR